MPARRYVVSGRVQGVYFRYFTRELATRLGIVGWVRNRADGAVEAEAEGTEAALDEFRRGLEAGPPAARVTGLTETPLESQPEWETFEVVY